ncbi:MAG: DUF3300 domain-containing protein [Wenzhouxiangellaceae bacterium]|nr:DUF3300 domain-containing protein [Wenzhouxiangellaceae bacterium]
MKTAKARITIILAALLALGLGMSAERAPAQAPPIAYSQAELDQMLAPIALYPDTVLSHVLIAATYPLDVVQAARWSRANPGYDGEYAVRAVEHMPWHPSVMALVAFPELLARMDADLHWTQRLGEAFLYQEYEVLDTVQYLRDEAYAAGYLRSNEYVRVVREPSYIYVEPAVTRVVYVPYYDPRVVYGSWRYAAYPPVWWEPPHYHRPRSGFGFSFHWSGGHHVESAFFFSSVHWTHHRVVVHEHHRYGHRHHGTKQYAGHHYSSGRDVVHSKTARHWKDSVDNRRRLVQRGSGRRDAAPADYRDHQGARSRHSKSDRHARVGSSSRRTAAVESRARRLPESSQRSRQAQRSDRESAVRSSRQSAPGTSTRRATADRSSKAGRNALSGRSELSRDRSSSLDRSRASRQASRSEARTLSRPESKRASRPGTRSSSREGSRQSSRSETASRTRSRAAERSASSARSTMRASSSRSRPTAAGTQKARSRKAASPARSTVRSSRRVESKRESTRASTRGSTRTTTGSSTHSSTRATYRAPERKRSSHSTRTAPKRGSTHAGQRAARVEAPDRARRGGTQRAERLRSGNRDRRR